MKKNNYIYTLYTLYSDDAFLCISLICVKPLLEGIVTYSRCCFSKQNNAANNNYKTITYVILFPRQNLLLQKYQIYTFLFTSIPLNLWDSTKHHYCIFRFTFCVLISFHSKTTHFVFTSRCCFIYFFFYPVAGAVTCIRCCFKNYFYSLIIIPFIRTLVCVFQKKIETNNQPPALQD